MINTNGVDMVVCVSLPWLVIAILWIFTKLFLIIRPRFPVIVNCWFCSKTCCVLYKNANSWDCPHCLQYNGFTEDGDYNKDIPEQYRYVNRSYAVPRLMSQIPNRLCERCNSVQELKVRKLAEFQPAKLAAYEAEVAKFELMLERLCSLCSSCENLVNKIINQKLARALRAEYSMNTKNSQFQMPSARNRRVSLMWSALCHYLCSLLALILVSAVWFTKQGVSSTIPHLYLKTILDSKECITIAALFGLLILLIVENGSVPHICSMIAWAAVHCLGWLITETELPDGWKIVDLELVLLSLAAVLNVIALTTGRQKTFKKKVQFTKISVRRVHNVWLTPCSCPVFRHLWIHSSISACSVIGRIELNVPVCTLHGKQWALSDENEEITNPQKDHVERSGLCGPKLDSDIAKLQLGSRELSTNDQQWKKDRSTVFHCSTIIRPSKLNVPVYETNESILRPQVSSFTREYQQIQNSFHMFSAQSSMIPR